MKQIIFEPHERVKIQENLPEDKAGYQVIDRIEIDNNLVSNNLISLNANLTSIIGGRSTGKSVLLAAIAKKLKTDKPVTFLHSPKYDEFVNGISRSMTIIWKDQKEENNREIEYFHQGYMYDLARQEEKLSALIQDILCQKGKDGIIDAYNKSILENKKRMSELVSDLFKILKDISDKEQKVRDKGDKKGIEDEIRKLVSELEKLNTTDVSDTDKQTYYKVKSTIESYTEDKTLTNNDIQIVDSLKLLRPFKENISYELTAISDSRKATVEDIYEKLKAEFELKFKAELDSIVTDAQKRILEIDELLATSSIDSTYVLVFKAFKDSTQLQELENKIFLQKEKLFDINNLINEVDNLKKQCDEIKINIAKFQEFFSSIINEVVKNLSYTVDGLEIKAKPKFKDALYTEILMSALNQRFSEIKTFLTGAQAALKNLTHEQEVLLIFEKLLKNELPVKGGFTNQSLATNLLAENFYNISYDLEYEGDDFEKMSDGKKAFVVLKLLLDFSNKDCPILIDQPEDDLDNRAIYVDLVQYLKKKKKLRQIIVATHNPNIVVGSDTELVLS